MAGPARMVGAVRPSARATVPPLPSDEANMEIRFSADAPVEVWRLSGEVDDGGENLIGEVAFVKADSGGPIKLQFTITPENRSACFGAFLSAQPPHLSGQGRMVCSDAREIVDDFTISIEFDPALRV